MSVAIPMFDRTEILEAIRHAWLGAHGDSGVLVGAHKCGKSFLLDHIYDNNNSPDLIVCRVNPHVLSSEADSAGGSLDQAFLHHLIRRLHLELERWLEEPAQDEQRLHADLRNHQARLDEAIANPQDPELRALFEQNVKALKARSRELCAAKRIVNSAAAMLATKEIAIADVASLVERLMFARKRIVLLIDDYHCIVGQRSLGNAIFNFLRGASREGAMITLATSPTSLMDAALHGGDESRIALFNHFRAQVLRPFEQQQADQFLDWLADGSAAMSSSDKAYLFEFSGGSPHFLRIARDAYIRARRPATLADRQQMERDIALDLSGALRDLFARCSPSRRAILHEVAMAGMSALRLNKDVQGLVDDGYLAAVPGGYRVSSRILEDYIKQQQRPDAHEGVTASVVLPYRILPTAQYYATPGSPLIEFHLHNPTTTPVVVTLRCELVNLSEKFKEDVTLGPNERKVAGIKVVLKLDKVREIRTPQFLQLNYSAAIEGNGPRRYVKRTSETLEVMPVDYFTFARVDFTQRRVIESAWLIAAWINATDRALDMIRQDALERNGGALSGYPNPPDPEAVQDIVRAIYDAVKASGLNYDSSALVFHKENGAFAQRVRRPAQVVESKAGNCLEACVVFATLLSASDLHPVILLLPGHAIVGWKDRDGGLEEWQFIETTGIRTDSFTDALRKGQDRYLKVKPLCDTWLAKPQPELRNTEQFAIPVDIHAEFARRHISPLP